MTGLVTGGGLDINPNQLSLKADAGGDIQIAFAAAPNASDDCRWGDNIVLTCDGTSYTVTNVDFIVGITVLS